MILTSLTLGLFWRAPCPPVGESKRPLLARGHRVEWDDSVLPKTSQRVPTTLSDKRWCRTSIPAAALTWNNRKQTGVTRSSARQRV